MIRLNGAAWLAAARLRTLPLACSATLCGAWLAHQQDVFQLDIAVLATITAMALQVFSNFANDYGDALHGADRYREHAPQRMVATGKIAVSSMRWGLLVQALVCCGLGGVLLSVAAVQTWGMWLVLGASALIAAFTYTAGVKPYGYYGLGDVAVWLFFGGLGVAGSEALYSGQWQLRSLLPASAVGCWCVMVLNLNNMRDRFSDQQAGKYTLAVRLGARWARHYQAGLAIIAWVCWLIWLPVQGQFRLWLAVVWVLTGVHLWQVYRVSQAAAFDRLLPQWSISVLAMVLLLWWC